MKNQYSKRYTYKCDLREILNNSQIVIMSVVVFLSVCLFLLFLADTKTRSIISANLPCQKGITSYLKLING